jgi:hypothetical protein
MIPYQSPLNLAEIEIFHPWDTFPFISQCADLVFGWYSSDQRPRGRTSDSHNNREVQKGPVIQDPLKKHDSIVIYLIIDGMLMLNHQ